MPQCAPLERSSALIGGQGPLIGRTGGGESRLVLTAPSKGRAAGTPAKGAAVPSSYLMRDVIVCIPGITGSVLRKDGKDIWNVSGGAILNALRTLGGSVKELKLEEDPVDADDVDGITATSVIRDVHLIPGLWKIDGYTKLVRHIEERFDVKHGENLFEFAYDWRRDNRVASRQRPRRPRAGSRRGGRVREPRREARPHRPLDGRTRRVTSSSAARVGATRAPSSRSGRHVGSLRTRHACQRQEGEVFDLTEIAPLVDRLSAAADLPATTAATASSRASRRRGSRIDPAKTKAALASTRFATPSRRT